MKEGSPISELASEPLDTVFDPSVACGANHLTLLCRRGTRRQSHHLAGSVMK
jgi:hypothetical protein